MTNLPADLTYRAVEASTWPDFERLFSSRGAPHYCWCLPYRATCDEMRQRDRATLKAGMARRIGQGEPVGLLAYDGDKPTAWCSIAPRPTFPRLNTSGVNGATDANDTSIWSLTCFFVPRPLRGLGMASRLLHAAVAYARSQGAVAVEAYPVDPESPSYGYGGRRPMFAAAGFRDIGRLGKRRYVMRLDLPDAAKAP